MTRREHPAVRRSSIAVAVLAWALAAPSAPVLAAPFAAVQGASPSERLPPGVPAHDVARGEGDDPQRTLAEVIALLGPASIAAGPSVTPLDANSPEAEDVRRRAARGAEALAQGKPLKAVPDFEAAVAMSPGDPELLRSLALTYTQVGNEPRALEVYERLLLVRPDDPQALVATGMALAAKRQFEDSLRRIAGGLESSERGAEVGRSLPLASRILAERGMAGVLRELGFDGASIEASTRAIASLDSLDASLADEAAEKRPDTTRLRAEILLARADAAARLGRNDDAIADLRAIVDIPGAEPDIVLPRELLLLERASKHAEADERLARALKPDAPPTTREVDLAEWLVSRSAERPALGEAARAQIAAHPESFLAVRLLACIDANAGAEACRAFLVERPRHEDAWRTLLRSTGDGGAAKVAAVLVDEGAKHPDAGATLVRAALASGVREGDLRRSLRSMPASPARDAALVRLAILGRELGRAWSMAVEARGERPGDVGLALVQLEAAAALEEPVLLDALEGGAAGTAAGLPDDPRLAPALALARRSAGDLKVARSALETLAAATPPNGGAPVLAALASMVAEEAASMRADDPRRREVAERARDLATRALELDADEADAALVLLRLHDPRSGSIADAEQWAALRSRLRSGPLAWLDERVSAEEEMARGRSEQGIARLRALAESRPHDGDLVGLAVSSLARAERAAEALRWLDAALAKQPGLVSLRDARLSAMVAAGQAELALAEVEAALEQDPDDGLASWHREALLRAVGRAEEAITRNRERIKARPPGPRRALELANLEERAERPAEALAAIEAIGGDALLTNAQRLAAVQIVSRLPSSIPGRNDRLVELAAAGLASADEERVVYAAAAAAGVMDDAKDGTKSEQEEGLARVRGFAEQAARNSNADAIDVAQIIRWRDSAQMLVDAEVPEAAAELLRARLLAEGEIPVAGQRVLQSAAFACDAAAGDRADEAMSLLAALRDRGERPFSWTRNGAETKEEALMALSSLFTVVGDREGSERILEALIAESPSHAMARNNLAWSRVERGVVDERTRALAEQALEAAPNESAILDTLGWIRYLNGELEDDAGRLGALSLLRRSAELGSADPSMEVLDHLGDALWRSGDHDGAIAAWKQVGRIATQRFDRNAALPQIGNYLLSETGLRIVDPGRFFETHFERAAQRAATKLADVEQGRDPAIAPLVASAAHPGGGADSAARPGERSSSPQPPMR